MSDQKSTPFETPDRAEIPGITRGHVAAMEASDGEPRDVWVMYNMKHLLLRTIGRKSGRVHKVALPYWIDPEGHPIVVGSYSGAEKHPAWYLNISDEKAERELYVKTRTEQYWAELHTLEGEERARIWPLLIADRSYYADYQAKTARQLPVIRILEARPAAGPPDD